jgi:hypothetical protein
MNRLNDDKDMNQSVYQYLPIGEFKPNNNGILHCSGTAAIINFIRLLAILYILINLYNNRNHYKTFVTICIT